MKTLPVGSLIVSKSPTVHTESGVGLTFKLKKGVAAVSLLLGFSSNEEPFTEEDENKAFRTLGFIGYRDLLEYLPKEKILEIERAERKKFNI